MSFVEEEDLYTLLEGMVKHVWKQTIGVDIPTPFKRLAYKEAMLTYGSDKPDLRFDLPIVDVTAWAKTTSFEAFKTAECVRALKVKGDFSRKQTDKLTELAKVYGAQGLAFIKKENNELTTGISKFISKEPFTIANGETVFFIAGTERKTAPAMGALRLELGKQLELIDKKQWNFLWVTDFPLMEWSEERQGWGPMHHPFTSPNPEDRHYLKTEPWKANSRAYDLVLNGNELGGGSIRIHDAELQAEVFAALKITPKEQEEKFGFLLGALSYGAPPHGGLAFGLDRMVMLLIGADNIREVIAFPKTKDAEDLMMQAPSVVKKEQLDELGIQLQK